MTAALHDILIIDDNKVDREAVRRSLNPPGSPPAFAIHEADGGRKGLELLKKRGFYCVFLDYLLPDMDGLKLLREIHDPETDMGASPVVMLTGQGSEAVMLEALRLGAQDYLVKENITPDTLNIALKKAREIFDLKDKRREAEEQLQHMRRMDAVGQLTSGIAHDFNNLLTVVLGNLHLMRQRAENNRLDAEYALKKIDTMETVARNGAELVRRLMVFTRQRPLQQRNVNINDCITDTCEILKRSLGESIEIRTRLGRDVPVVHIDPMEFGNVLINMAVNARDAMPKGGTLTIATENATVGTETAAQNPELQAGDYTLVTVSDTGNGMSEETARRVFEPFFTTKPAGEGTGLGLSMAYGFVRQSGGHITVDSVKNRGTTFRIFLPDAVNEKRGAREKKNA